MPPKEQNLGGVPMKENIKMTDINPQISTGSLIYADIDIFRFIYEQEINNISVLILNGEHYDFLEELKAEDSYLNGRELGMYASRWIRENVEIVAVIEELQDNVNNPSHYQNGGKETIEIIKDTLATGFNSYLEGNIIKYISRYKYKNGVEDLKKARFYLNRLIEEVEK